MTTADPRYKFRNQNEVFDSFVRTINLVPRAFPLSSAEKPCTSPVKVFGDVDADTSKSSAEFELKVLLPSPTTGKVRKMRDLMSTTATTVSENGIFAFAAEELSSFLQSTSTKKEKKKKKSNNKRKAAVTESEVTDTRTFGFFLFRPLSIHFLEESSCLFFFVEVECKTAGDNSSVASLNTRSLE